MDLKSFFALVEIRTKLASTIPCITGTLYALRHFQNFSALKFALFFVSLFSIDMFTTALNNYRDFKLAYRKSGYNYELHNIIARKNLKEYSVLAVLVLLFTAAATSGIILVFKTNIIVLLVGAISFLVGIFYSSGPVPISRTPFGEAFSGFFMGFVILFLSIYIHLNNPEIISVRLKNSFLSLQINYVQILYIFLLSLPYVLCIANIMLANNICDLEEDKENRRYTLPVYIGKRSSLILFKLIYLAAYADIIFLSVSGLVPVLCLFALLTLVLAYKNIKLFNKIQTKKDTFVLSVKNFVFICGSLTLLFFTGWVLKI
ncbi:MAG: 1,4-dihydroxy-2-naphthoate polyprenyltransferase [Bacillota bacterium]|nr:1,4-dihydroxy-2-naphthoate polyprenyltransferase [Bacillota bacterium]